MSGPVFYAQSFPGLVLLGISVLASLELFYRDRPEGEDPLHLMLTVIGRVMILTGFLEAGLMFLSIMAIPFGLTAVGVLVYVALRYRRRRRMALLAVLAAASRRWMPLAPAVEAFSHEWRGAFGRRCRRLAESLQAGLPLGEALRTVGSLAPARAVALIEAGERGGNLGGALAEVVRRPASQPLVAKLLGTAWYFGAFVLAGGGILTFLMIKIVPAYIKIFDDFDADLPGLTVALIAACDGFALYGWQMVLLGALGATAFAVLHIIGVVRWLPPPLGAESRRLQIIVVLRALAVAADVGRPLEPALAALAAFHPSPAMRARLTRAMAQISQGRPWLESLADQGLLRAEELALLASAQRVGNLPWALREAADGIERRVCLRLQGWLEALGPVCVLLAGAVVLVIVVGCFAPLVKLIENLT